MKIFVYSKKKVVRQLLIGYIEKYFFGMGKHSDILIQEVSQIDNIDLDENGDIEENLIIADYTGERFFLNEEIVNKIKILLITDSEIPDIRIRDNTEIIPISSLNQLIACMNEVFKDIKDNKILDTLTGREKEILKLIAKGLLNKEIANELDITERTVKNHISNIFKKINVYDRTQAAVFAIKNKIFLL